MIEGKTARKSARLDGGAEGGGGAFALNSKGGNGGGELWVFAAFQFSGKMGSLHSGSPL
jgi:hypothetical protein